MLLGHHTSRPWTQRPSPKVRIPAPDRMRSTLLPLYMVGAILTIMINDNRRRELLDQTREPSTPAASFPARDGMNGPLFVCYEHINILRDLFTLALSTITWPWIWTFLIILASSSSFLLHLDWPNCRRKKTNSLGEGGKVTHFLNQLGAGRENRCRSKSLW